MAAEIPSGPLVSPAWLEENLGHPGIVIVESNEDPGLYGTGHIPEARHLHWRRDLNDPSARDVISETAFASLAGRLGIDPSTTVVFYGDRTNWWAAYSLWIFHLFGHTRTKLLDGGRDRWVRDGRPMTTRRPAPASRLYPVPDRRRDAELRIHFDDILAHAQAGRPLVDVRSPHEYSGLITHPPEYPEEAVRVAGHIPGAVSVPWSLAVTESGRFRPVEALREIFEDVHHLHADDDIIVYCRIGERSSHSWFVLNQLLGYKHVRNYDGGWTEWGNRVGTPVETESPRPRG